MDDHASLPLPAPPPDEETPTVAAYLDDWVERQRTQLQRSTWRSYRGNIDRYLVPHIGDARLDELEVARLDDLFRHLLAEGGQDGKPLAIRTVTYAHGVLRTALEDARRVGLIDHNVARDVRLPRVDPRTGQTADTPTINIWSAEELRRFLDFVTDHPLCWLWHVAAGTGVRRGELLAIAWDDVDLDTPAVRIHKALGVYDGDARRKDTKSGRPRTIHLDHATADAFRRQRQEQDDAREDAGRRWSNPWDLVFTTERGRYLSPSYVSREFRALVRAAPVPTIRLHDVRHAHASLLLAEGVPVKVVSERLGHARIEITLNTYAHCLPAMDQAAATTYAQAIWGEETTGANGGGGDS